MQASGAGAVTGNAIRIHNDIMAKWYGIRAHRDGMQSVPAPWLVSVKVGVSTYVSVLTLPLCMLSYSTAGYLRFGPIEKYYVF